MTRIGIHLLIFAFSFTTLSYAQNKQPEIPKKIQKSIPDLATYLTKGETDPFDKVERIYEWITGNINYDYDKLTSHKSFVGTNPEKIL